MKSNRHVMSKLHCLGGKLWRVCWRTGFFAFFLAAHCAFAEENEVLPNAGLEVVVRDHSKTEKALVMIVDSESGGSRYTFLKNEHKFSRPDYQMLDHEKRAGEIAYDGPVSDRKKVYFLAAGLATAGVLAGTLTPVAATTAATSTSGAGALAGAGVAVTAGTIAASHFATRPDLTDDNFSHSFEAKLKEIRTSKIKAFGA